MKKWHEYYNFKKPVNCKYCEQEIPHISKCRVLLSPEAIKKIIDNKYEAELNENDVEYVCLDCCNRSKK